MPNKGVARLGDKCTGHGWFGPRPSTGGSDNVFVNGRPAHRLYDSWAKHRCGKAEHDSVLDSGAARVYVNGLKLGHIDARVKCGSKVAEGSDNVFVNPD